VPLYTAAQPPSRLKDTAIVKGYNALTGANVKLGRSDEYLAMRKDILELNAAHRSLLSDDLGV
jgi:type II restriction enzyme